MDRSRAGAEYEERWFLMQIIVRGSSCLVRIDGETASETGRLPAAAEFRDLRARPL